MDLSLGLGLLTTVVVVSSSSEMAAILITGGDPLSEVGLSVEMFLPETGDNLTAYCIHCHRNTEPNTATPWRTELSAVVKTRRDIVPPPVFISVLITTSPF